MVFLIDEDNAVGVVPTKWIVKGQNICYWPPDKGPSLNSKIVNCVLPDILTWNCFKATDPGGNLKVYGMLELISIIICFH